jgi:hypothetical protein
VRGTDNSVQARYATGPQAREDWNDGDTNDHTGQLAVGSSGARHTTRVDVYVGMHAAPSGRPTPESFD